MPLHPLNFLDWGASVVTTPTLSTNTRKCVSFSKKPATLTRCNHRQTSRSSNRPIERPHYNVTERKNQLNSIHPPPPSTKLCNQKCLCEIYMKCILYCGCRWKWRVIIAVNFQFKQLEGRTLKNIRASTGLEPVTSATRFAAQLVAHCTGVAEVRIRIPLSRDIFQASSFQLLKFETYCDDHSSLLKMSFSKTSNISAMIPKLKNS